ncbi:MAG: hypothetical protein JSR77_00215 [Planctomycetes bacterium]|nr:hypothetical protein [Planctomycetota bacterium]
MNDQAPNLPSGVEDYLWDTAAPVAPQVAAMEQPLAALAAPSTALFVPPAKPARRAWWLALAASLLLAAALFILTRSSTPPIPGGWTISSHTGPITTSPVKSQPGSLLIAMDAGAKAELTGPQARRISAGDSARFVLAASGDEISLEHGSIFLQTGSQDGALSLAFAGARATLSPHAAAQLATNERGATLTLKTGNAIIMFGKGQRVRVPAEARCELAPDGSAATPRYYDAPGILAKSLAVIDSAYAGEKSDPRDTTVALESVLKAARPRDAMTLWHVLQRVPRESRGPIVDRMQELAPAAAKSSPRDALINLDPAALDAWWNDAMP